MPVTPSAPAPYAPATSILELVRRHRNRGLPNPVNSEVLARAGIPESLIPRTIQALQTLDLIDGNGTPSAVLEGIRRAPDGEYKQRIADWLRAAYADALQFIDPATATEGEIRDAFRNYIPIGQQHRMVTLFTGLFREADIGPERPTRTAGNPSTKPVVSRAAPKAKASLSHAHIPSSGALGGLPTPLAGLLTSLPTNGAGWPKAKRDKFLVTFEAVLDFCVPIVEETTDAEAADTNEASAA